MKNNKKEPLLQKAQEKLIKQILYEIGENPEREGLIDTPKRVVQMWNEIFRGYNPKQKPQIITFPNGKDGIFYDQMIIDAGEYYSHCEHHMVPFFGRYWFAYIPSEKGGIVGLSKVARIIDYHSAKLQIQERLVNDIVNDIWDKLSSGYEAPPVGMGLVMKGHHLCKEMRGVKKKGEMTTIKLLGVMKENIAAREEFLKFVK